MNYQAEVLASLGRILTLYSVAVPPLELPSNYQARHLQLLAAISDAIFAAPSDVLLEVVSGSSGSWNLVLSFTPPAVSVEGYTFEYSYDGGPWMLHVTASLLDSSTVSFPGQSNGTRQYRVRADYASGSSAWVESNLLVLA